MIINSYVYLEDNKSMVNKVHICYDTKYSQTIMEKICQLSYIWFTDLKEYVLLMLAYVLIRWTNTQEQQKIIHKVLWSPVLIQSGNWWGHSS